MNGRGEIGPLERFLSEDHRRLEALLQTAVKNPDRMDLDPYGRFRAGLLKHISMEEKILLPAATQSRGGAPLPVANKLRLDHGALTALLVPSPTPAIVGVIRSILERHNEIEEGRDGLYATCDRLLGSAAADLLAQMHAAPEVPVSAYNDGATVMPAVCRALQRAGYHVEADQLLAT